MYKIKKIKANKNDVFTLDIDDIETGESETVQVAGGVLSTLGILKPCEITQEQYNILLEKTQFYKAYTKTLHYLSFRKRSKKEVRTYLHQKVEASDTVIEDVVNKLEEQQYLNDVQFIASYVTNSFIVSHKGPTKLKYELLNLGCKPQDIENGLQKYYDYDKEMEQLTKLFAKLANKKYGTTSQYQKKCEQKAYELGFSQEKIQQLLSEMNKPEVVQIDTSKNMRIIQKEYDKLQKKKTNQYTIKQKIKQKLVAKQMSFSEAEEMIETFFAELDEE